MFFPAWCLLRKRPAYLQTLSPHTLGLVIRLNWCNQINLCRVPPPRQLLLSTNTRCSLTDVLRAPRREQPMFRPSESRYCQMMDIDRPYSATWQILQLKHSQESPIHLNTLIPLVYYTALQTRSHSPVVFTRSPNFWIPVSHYVFTPSHHLFMRALIPSTEIIMMRKWFYSIVLDRFWICWCLLKGMLVLFIYYTGTFFRCYFLWTIFGI